MLDPLVLEEKSLITCSTREQLALEHDISNLDSLSTKSRWSSPCVHSNEWLFSANIDGWVPVILDPVVPVLIIVVWEVR